VTSHQARCEEVEKAQQGRLYRHVGAAAVVGGELSPGLPGLLPAAADREKLGRLLAPDGRGGTVPA